MKDVHGELVRLHQKIDRVVDKQAEMNATLASQHVSLEEHMKRTALLEQEVKPIKAHVTLMNSAAKVVAFGSAALMFVHKMGWF